MLASRFQVHLAARHISYTVPRQTIFTALSRWGPCTRQDLVRHLAGKVDQATVYRTITLFLKTGIATEVRPGRLELTDRFKQHHHHLVCNDCNLEISFHHEGLEKALDRIAQGRGFWVDNHTIELTGLCRDCAAAAGKTGTGLKPGQVWRQPGH